MAWSWQNIIHLDSSLHFILPSRELTYPPKMAYLKMIFLFPRWDVLVSERVYPLHLCIFAVILRWDAVRAKAPLQILPLGNREETVLDSCGGFLFGFEHWIDPDKWDIKGLKIDHAASSVVFKTLLNRPTGFAPIMHIYRQCFQVHMFTQNSTLRKQHVYQRRRIGSIQMFMIYSHLIFNLLEYCHPKTWISVTPQEVSEKNPWSEACAALLWGTQQPAYQKFSSHPCNVERMTTLFCLTLTVVWQFYQNHDRCDIFEGCQTQQKHL